MLFFTFWLLSVFNASTMPHRPRFGTGHRRHESASHRGIVSVSYLEDKDFTTFCPRELVLRCCTVYKSCFYGDSHYRLPEAWGQKKLPTGVCQMTRWTSTFLLKDSQDWFPGFKLPFPIFKCDVSKAHQIVIPWKITWGDEPFCCIEIPCRFTVRQHYRCLTRPHSPLTIDSGKERSNFSKHWLLKKI